MNITLKEITKNPWKQVFKDIRLSQKVINNRRSQFVSKFMKKLCNQLGIEKTPSTAYHLQTNRQTEKINQEIKQYLQLYINKITRLNGY